MTYDDEISIPIAELLASKQEAIARYKWCESQRLGQDIGWQRAETEWYEKHFLNWVQTHHFLIDEALSMASPSTAHRLVEDQVPAC